MTTPVDLMLDEEGTYGINMPLPADAGKLVVVNAAGDNHEFVDADAAIVADGTLATALSPLQAGRHLQHEGSGLLGWRRQTQYAEFWDDFMVSRSLDSGNTLLGDTPWVGGSNDGNHTFSNIAVGGGGLSALVGTASLASHSDLNDSAYICKSVLANRGIIDCDQLSEVIFCVAPNTAADCKIVVGVGSDIANGSFGAESVRFEFNTATDTAWRAYRRTGSVDGSALVAGSLTSGGQYRRLAFVRSGSNLVVYHDNDVLGSLAVLSNTSVNIGVRVETLTTATRTVLLDAVGMRSTALTGFRAWTE